MNITYQARLVAHIISNGEIKRTPQGNPKYTLKTDFFLNTVTKVKTLIIDEKRNLKFTYQIAGYKSKTVKLSEPLAEEICDILKLKIK